MEWLDSVGGNCVPCRWPVLNLYHLQVSSAMYPAVACATQRVLLILSGVYRQRKMRATHPSSQRGKRKAERCMFHCAQWHWRTSTSSSDGGSSSTHINHSLLGLPCFPSSSAAFTVFSLSLSCVKRQINFISCKFKLFSKNSISWICICCCLLLLVIWLDWLSMIFLLVSHKLLGSEFVPHKSFFIV